MQMEYEMAVLEVQQNKMLKQTGEYISSVFI